MLYILCFGDSTKKYKDILPVLKTRQGKDRLDPNNYSRFTVTNFTSICWTPAIYLILCRGTGDGVIKEKPCFEGAPSLVEGTER